jgi:N-acyl-D-amino-acid deacylase
MRRTIRLFLSIAAFCALVAIARGQPPELRPNFPVTGKAYPGLEPLDAAVVAVLKRHGIPGAALAIAKDGKLVYARGYGWADLAADKPVEPDTLFGIASLSKTITAAAVLKLVEQRRLKLDDRPFEMLRQIRPNPGARPDPRLKNITVRHLLSHSGGWDHQKSGDPVNWTSQVTLQRGGRAPVTPEQLIAFTLGVPLDFDPGTDCKYSNFGYVVLGEVIERTSGLSYERYVREHVFKPAGITRAALHPLNGKYFPGEARRYQAGTDMVLPPWQQKKSDAAGGWTASAVDLARFLTALDGSRDRALLRPDLIKEMTALPPLPLKARENGTHVGLGWDSVVLTDRGPGYFKDGSWFGTKTYMKRLPGGINWALLFNAGTDLDPEDFRTASDALKSVRERLDRQAKLPDVDLFAEFP